MKKEKDFGFLGLEEYVRIEQMKKELAQYGLYVSEGKNWVEKAQLVIRTLFRETKTLRFLVVSIMLASVDWPSAILTLSIYSSFLGIGEYYRRKHYI